MNALIKDCIKLVTITVIAGAALGAVYGITKEPIAAQEEKKQMEAYAAVFPEAAEFAEVDGFTPEAAAEVLSSGENPIAGHDDDEITSVVEAAIVDGCGWWKLHTKIKIPMIMPSVTICTFLTLTNGFKMFDQNLSLTGGDPGKQSQLLALNIYDTFYARSGPQWKGIGQAKAVVFFILVVAIALVQLKATSSKEVQQ